MADKAMVSRGGVSPGWWRVPAVLLALAGLVVAATVMLWMRQWAPDPREEPSPDDPGEARRVVAAAKALLQTGQTDRAIDLMTKYARGVAPTDTIVRPVLAETLLDAGRPDQAEKIVGELLTLAPRSPEGLWLKGRLLKRRSDDSWIDAWAQAAEQGECPARILAEYGLALVASGGGPSAEKILLRAESRGADESKLLAALGEISAGRQDWGAAEQWFSRAIKGDEQNASLWARLVQVQRRANRLDEAAGTIGRALEKLRRWKDRPGLLFELGEIRLLQHRRADAAAAFGGASDAQPGWALAALMAAQSYYHEGRYALAMKYIDRALGLLPDDADIREWVGKIEEARFGPSRGESPVTQPTATSGGG